MMPDNYVQDPYNSQNFNRYSYVLNNPLRYTDPTGEMMDESLDDIITNLWKRGGGNWNPVDGYSYGSDAGFAHGVGYMNQYNLWGGGGGNWASSPGEALNNYLASGASEGGLQYSYSNGSGSGVFRTDTYHGSSYFDDGMGEGYNLIGIVAGGYDVDFGNGSSSSSGAWGWVQTGLDILGSTEIPIVSQLADLGSAGISFAQGDYSGASMSLGGMFIPGLSQAKLGLKFAKGGTTVFRAVDATEAAIIRNTGKFSLQPGGVEAKYFAKSFEDAHWYGQRLYPNGYSIIQGTVKSPVDAGQYWFPHVDIGSYVFPKETLPYIIPH